MTPTFMSAGAELAGAASPIGVATAIESSAIPTLFNLPFFIFLLELVVRRGIEPCYESSFQGA